MVEGEMVDKALLTSGKRRPYSAWYPGSHRGRMTLRRLEHGRLAASQIFLRGFMIVSF
ncbi:MAG: hypothetical protein ABID54_12265 [Pseudomonadota bacterium]